MAMVQVTNPLDLMPITSVLKENPLSLAMQKICSTWFSINAILALAKSEEKSITVDTQYAEKTLSSHMIDVMLLYFTLVNLCVHLLHLLFAMKITGQGFGFQLSLSIQFMGCLL